MTFEPIIGLEVHLELKTKSKMFCGCPADWFGKDPNTLTCPVCLGLPGSLPVPNKKAVDWTILLGLALDCQVNLNSKFDRKNYFYPDLPKGYQISQYDQPIATGGSLKIKNQKSNIKNNEERIIRIRRVHLEEDTGKLLHCDQITNYDGPPDSSLIDFNRGGVPLVEIVTEPDFRSSEEAKEFLKKIQLLVRYLDISDADMEKGSMRIEPSISLALKEDRPSAKDGPRSYPNYRVEIKNINSFRFAQKAIEYEINRQTKLLERGVEVVQETRGWNEAKNQTVSQRSKEEAHDYRYFGEPDIPPMQFTKSQISNLKSQIPELPEAKIRRFIKDWSVKASDAAILVDGKKTCKIFEELAIKALEREFPIDKLASLIVNKKIEVDNINPEETINRLVTESSKPSLSTEQVNEICQKILEVNVKVAEEYRKGRRESLQFLIGLVMRETSGRANPKSVKDLLIELIER